MGTLLPSLIAHNQSGRVRCVELCGWEQAKVTAGLHFCGRDVDDRELGTIHVLDEPAVIREEVRSAVTEPVVAHLAPVRERYGAIRDDARRREETLVDGAKRAQAVAGRTLADVHEAMGLSAERSP